MVHLRYFNRPCDILNFQLLHLSYWRCPHRMQSMVYVTVGRPSVCLSVPSTDSSNAGRLVCCWAPCGRRYRSIAAGALRTPCCRRRHSSSKYWQRRVKSRQRRLKTYLLAGIPYIMHRVVSFQFQKVCFLHIACSIEHETVGPRYQWLNSLGFFFKLLEQL